MKRFFDLFLIFGTAPVWVPVFLFLMGLTLLIMGRPIFFRDRRAGKGGREFTLFKFRTMRNGSGSDAERLTFFGRVMRTTSLDELPEIFNVVKGEMSLVGPRPLPVRYLPRYTPEQNRRHEALPGITGWAQVNGRNALDWNEKFRYDVEYVDRQSLAFDIKILFLTLAQLVHPRQVNHQGEATMSEFKAEEK